MPKLSFPQRSVAIGAASILLAAFQAGCGGGSPGGSAGVVTPFDPANQGSQQPGSSTSNSPGSGAQPSGDTQPSSGTQSSGEAQQGNLPLSPGMTASGTQSGGATPSSGQMDPGMAPPDTTPPTMDQPPATDAPAPTLERPTKGTPNVFTRDLGIAVGEVDAKLTTAVNRYFGIGTNESDTPVADTGYRVYYELPQNHNQAFIWTSDQDEVRSEGQSYGMMIAVQMNMQDQFDKLWNFAKAYMQYAPNAAETSWRYCFHWQGTVNRSNANNWAVSFPAGPAPDGDQYFTAALYLADRRWGSGGAVNYEQEADNISHAMITNPSAGDNTPLFNAQSNLPVFFPNRFNVFTDPSYNLPAFYEIFAQDGAPADAARWNAIADASRNLIVSSANATTGLHPDYANFDGTPNTGGAGQTHDQFAYDAWRVIMNMAVDFAWFSNDARFTTQANKYHAFFANQLNANKDNVVNQIYNLDGSNASGGNSTALTSTLGAGAIASTAPNRLDFVNAAWNVYQQSGTYRYYQESVYILGMLATSGMYGYEWNGAAQ